MALDKKDPDLLAYKKAKSIKLKQLYAGRLLKANMALVQRLVTKYSRFAPGDVEREDLMQAGMIAFLRTLDKTDPRRPFSTLFAYWVRYEVGKCVERASVIYKPRGSGMPYAIYQKSREILSRTGRHATAAELGVSEDKLAKWLTLPHASASLDADLGDGNTLHDVTPDSGSPEWASDHAQLAEAISDLTPQEQRIIKALFLEDIDIEVVARRHRTTVAIIEGLRDRALERMREWLD